MSTPRLIVPVLLLVLAVVGVALTAAGACGLFACRVLPSIASPAIYFPFALLR